MKRQLAVCVALGFLIANCAGPKEFGGSQDDLRGDQGHTALPDAGEEADTGDRGRRDGGGAVDGSGRDNVGRDEGTDHGADADTPDDTIGEPSMLPTPKGECPALKDGPFTYNGATVQLTVGDKEGPVFFYFHGTASSPDEVDLGIPGARESVKTEGGLVATWDISSPMGDSTGSVWEVWHTGDFDVADQNPRVCHRAGYC
ncbi:MAG: hypothetical protein QM778_39090 [Myxococcales bacterium]